MSRRKISIEDALKVMEDAGIPLQPKERVVVEQPQQPKASPAFKKQAALPHSIRVTLFAKHSIGSGGCMAAVDGEKQVLDAGVQTYGPGICYVPTALAQDLLYADAAAKQADAKMLDRVHRSYLVVQKSNGGSSANVAMQVSDDFFDNGLGDISPEYMYRVI